MRAFIPSLLGVLLLAIGRPDHASAQPPPSNPNEMCGDGTTFEVQLPGVPGAWPLGLTPSPDSVELPNGCSIYAIFVSGYSVNPRLNYLTFYKLAKFVAERDGYVHYAWWNNFMGEYLRGPLHDSGVPELQPSPGGATHGLGFVPLHLPGGVGPAKAMPEEDVQFQADARAVIAEVRARNPNALIIVAGHSMGGSAVVRLGATPGVPIDVLAPIDPVGNRSTPVGIPGRFLFNWTRWRVGNDLRGYKRVDCRRTPLGNCEDFDDRPFHVSYRCQAVGPLLSQPPVFPSFAPAICPRAFEDPYLVLGDRPRIGANVRMLYHRWQKEFPFPFDVLQDERINRGPQTGLLGGNYQQPLLRNALGESNPKKSCGVSPADIPLPQLIGQILLPEFSLPPEGPQPQDPNDPTLNCSPYDGHGEIVGLRRDLDPIGVEALDWPCYLGLKPRSENCSPGESGPDQRRAKLVEMTNAEGDAWAHAPVNPELDLVVGDLLTIVQHVLDQQPSAGDDVAPVTLATTTPGANAAGWHADDVQIDLVATDAGGSGVQEIERSSAGAQTSPAVVTGGDVDQILVNAEGLTTVTFRARDDAGNIEAAQELVVRLDKTEPTITAETSAAPNAAGWFNSPVTVSFPAFDARSGLAASSPDVVVGAEGAAQEVLGTAEDVAGNVSSAAAILNIDQTGPSVVCDLANGQWHATNVSFPCGASDALSGLADPADQAFVLSTSVPVGVETADAATGSREITDVAGNVATAGPIGGNQVDRKPPSITVTTPAASAVYAINQAVAAAYTCVDGGSGGASCTGTSAPGAPVDTTSPGTKTFTVGAADNVGNPSTASVGYDVRYDVCLLYDPTKVKKAGNTIPIKLQACDAGGANLSQPDLVVTAVAVTQMSTNTSGPPEDAGNANPDGNFRYDASLPGYIFNLQTTGLAAGTWEIRFHIAGDPTEHGVTFQIH